MTRSVDPEENAALAVLAELGRTPGDENTRVTSAEDEVEDVLRRLHLEAMGLLAYELPPAPSSAALRAKVLERLSGDSTQEIKPLSETREPERDADEGFAPSPPAASADARPASEAPAAALAPVRVFPERGAASRPGRPWARALAAVLALVAAGLGVYAAYLQSELGATRARIARLQSDLRQVEGERTAERTALTAQLAELERLHAFASAPSVTVYALRPPPDAGRPRGRGTLWVAADGRRWQLEVRDLEPEPADRDYQLWFIADGVPVSGGVFDGRGARAATLADARMPAGTSAVAITLEPKGGVRAPTTPILLIADRSVTL